MAHVASRFLPIYLLIVVAVLLFPFDFYWPVKLNAATRGASSGVLELPGPGLVHTRRPPTEAFNALTTGTGLTIEIRLNSSVVDQTGPARIVSYSEDPWLRNFTVGQDRSDLIVRLRTTKNDLNGASPEIRIPDVFAKPGPLHLVISYDYEVLRVFRNSALVAILRYPFGDFSNWSATYDLLLGNEATGDRPWVGALELVSLYDRPLKKAEFSDPVAGYRPDPVLSYEFGTELGDRKYRAVPETGPALTSPVYFLAGVSMPFSQGNLRVPISIASGLEVLGNVVLFVPIGFCLLLSIQRRRWFFLMVVTFFFSGFFELVQFFLPGRFSSLGDLIVNLAGAALGGLLAAVLARYGLLRVFSERVSQKVSF